jgi:hypothetical protein
MTVARSRGPPERDRLLIDVRNRSINADDRSTRPFVYPFPSTSPSSAMTPTSSRVPSTAKARRSSALESALGPITPFLGDDRVVEVMLNADGVVWVDKHGKGARTDHAKDIRRMRMDRRASEIQIELLDERRRDLVARAARRAHAPSGVPNQPPPNEALATLEQTAAAIHVDAYELADCCDRQADLRGDVALIQLEGGIMGFRTRGTWRFRFQIPRPVGELDVPHAPPAGRFP